MGQVGDKVDELRSDLTEELRKIKAGLSELSREPAWKELVIKRLKSLRTFKGILAAFGLLTAAIGLLSAWYSLAPRASLVLGPISDQGYVFRSNISVSNDSVFAFRNVLINCRLGEKTGSDLAAPAPDYWRTVHDTFATELEYDRNLSVEIGPGQKATAYNFCADDSKLSFADVLLVVHFNYWFLPWKNDRLFRLVTVKRPNGDVEWMEEPFSEDRKPAGLT